LIIDQLEPEVLDRFAARIESVPLEKGAVLHALGEPIEAVWFPERGLICLASDTIHGESVSGGMVGWDGAYGAFEACGSRKSFTHAMVQVPGRARRIRAGVYREMFDASLALRTAVHKHVEALMAEARQFVACNAIHAVENRLARALLDVCDRSNAGDLLPLTQEALANMLGVQRTTIAVSVSSLQKAGLIRSGRGALEVLDKARLEKAACSCRAAIAYAHREIYASAEPVCEA
jgi:CRP-like cAMP-binding protein